MRVPLVSATPAFDANGTPWSPEYGDIYHSADSGPGQARHVFLGGNGLPQRWAHARVFTVLETGFGLGLNFLATWQAWRDDPVRPERLHFVSIEKHPFTRQGLAELHARYPELSEPAGRLQSAWPLALPGSHRLEFEDGGVTLTLAFGDVADTLRKLRCAADAIYLDGFAPDRNPEMWAPATLKAITRLARPGATLATYTSARGVRDALASAGFFNIEKRAGFGRKRDMLTARYAPRTGKRQEAPEPPVWPERRAIVVGAGLAGAAVSERLTSRGWIVDLIERCPAPATEASGIPAGVFHPHVSRDDSLLSRLTRAGSLYSLFRWRALEAAGCRISWNMGGVLQMAKDASEEARMSETTRVLGFPPAYVDYIEQTEAAHRAGAAVRCGGWWFPTGGWISPASLVAAQLRVAQPRLSLHVGEAVHELSHGAGLWGALRADGTVIALAPVVVLANSHDAARFITLDLPLRRVRGQLTHLPPGSTPAPGAVLAGAGHLIPMPDGSAIAGATFDYDDERTAPGAEDHVGNIERLERLLPGASARVDHTELGGAVGFRCVAADRLPLIGALPSTGRNAAVSARDVPRLTGVYGAFAYASRGLTWAALGAEIIAAELEGEPSPVESDLAQAIDPARFLLRRARRRPH